MEQRYMRLRAAIVLAALVGVPLAAVLGTWRPWPRPHTSRSDAPGRKAESDVSGRADPIAACPEPPSDAAREASEHRNDPPPETRDPAPEITQPLSTETAPTARIRDVVAETAENAAPGTAPARSQTEPGHGITRIWHDAQARLEALGAVSWRLESWGSQGLYRFSCAVSLAGQSRSTRYFEAVAARPELAIEQVVSEIEAFRAGQHTTASRPQPVRR